MARGAGGEVVGEFAAAWATGIDPESLPAGFGLSPTGIAAAALPGAGEPLGRVARGEPRMSMILFSRKVKTMNRSWWRSREGTHSDAAMILSSPT